MAQLIITINEEDITKRSNRQRILQTIADSPFSNDTLKFLSELVTAPGAEEKINKSRGALKLALNV